MSADHHSEETILEEALAFASKEARSAYLHGACSDDRELRARVESLIEAHEQAGVFLEKKTTEGAPTIHFELRGEDGPGTVIGRYKLLERVGEGGFGVVYVAEQREPVKRRVALKIIKLGMDTKQVVARFEAERQALAMMDHPNIAKVLDAGATETGRPYFVMELVRGVRLTEYCDQNHLSTRERLELFIKVCQAIQHAHQKGIIHRDIKPSNILVTLHDGVPVPKVIDFGIAKATQGELTDKTLYTQLQQFIGTPAYMSPEQAELSGLDIDTRADIYSLGVLLYELLTGKTPFDAKELMASGLEEMRRTIREKEPVRPSTRVNELKGEESTTTAKRRGQEPLKLFRLLCGDLDWIVMKCLEKDRARRYETANGLAVDINRHLNSEPVVARPPSSAYRLQKLVRRNKTAFAAAVIVSVMLVLGVAVSTWQAIRARRAERLQIGLREQAVVNEKKALQAQADTEKQRQAAEQARQGEAQQRQQAEELRKHAAASDYASDINLAQQAFAMNNFGTAWALLDRHRPEPGQNDLRGWEWRYLWQQLQSDALSTPCRLSNNITSIAVSPDGKWLVAAEWLPGGLSLLDISGPLRPRQADRLAAANGNIVTAFSPRETLLAFSSATTDPGPDGDRWSVHPDDRFKVHLWNPETRQMVAELPLEGKCRGLAFSADGRTLLTWQEAPNGEGQLALWRVPSLEKLAGYTPTHFPAGRGWRTFAAARDLTVAVMCSGKNGDPGRLQVFDLVAGKESWSRDVGTTSGVAFSPDGKLLLSAEGFNTVPVVRFWDAVSGKEIGPGLRDHRELISALVFWPDGKTLATASADQTIRLWDLGDPAHPRPLGRPLRGHKGEVCGLALLPDNKTLVSCGMDGSLLAWDTLKLRIDRTQFTLKLPGLIDGKFAPDSKSGFTVDSRGQVVQWRGSDFQTREALVDIGTNFSSACLSEDCRLLASGSTNGVIQLWDLQKRARLSEFSVGAGKGRAPRFLAQGKKLIVGEEDGLLVHVWDLATFQEIASWQDIVGPSLFSADERWYFTFGDGRFLARDMATGLQTVQTNRSLESKGLSGVAVSPDGALFAAASYDGFVRLFDRASLREIDTLRGFTAEEGNSVCFSPDGKHLATLCVGHEAILLWDLDRRQQLLMLEGGGRGNVFGMFSPDGNLFVAYNGHELHVWRAPSWEEIEAAEKAEAKTE